MAARTSHKKSCWITRCLKPCVNRLLHLTSMWFAPDVHLSRKKREKNTWNTNYLIHYPTRTAGLAYLFEALSFPPIGDQRSFRKRWLFNLCVLLFFLHVYDLFMIVRTTVHFTCLRSFHDCAYYCTFYIVTTNICVLLTQCFTCNVNQGLGDSWRTCYKANGQDRHGTFTWKSRSCCQGSSVGIFWCMRTNNPRRLQKNCGWMW